MSMLLAAPRYYVASLQSLSAKPLCKASLQSLSEIQHAQLAGCGMKLNSYDWA